MNDVAAMQNDNALWTLDDVVELKLRETEAFILYTNGDVANHKYADVLELKSVFDMLRERHEPQETNRTSDFGLSWNGRRWRGHLYHHMNGWSVALRVMPFKVHQLADLDFDREQVLSLARNPGLCLFAGATGSGKSTTLAAVVNALEEDALLGPTVTIENPVEYLHRSPLIEQRQVGDDTQSFASGVIEAMRQNPETIVIGEIRDSETADAAIQAGLTGHRVLATLHARDIRETLVRLMALLPEAQKRMMPMCLQGMMAQQLEKLPGMPPIPVYETLECTDSVASLVSSGVENLPRLNHEFSVQGREGLKTMRSRLKADGIIP
jgi:Tfp pilus assembly pilus retraction ATPase PilT